MIVAREDSEALWLEIFSNKMAPGTDSMCVINTATEKNCPYDYEESVFFLNIIFNKLAAI